MTGAPQVLVTENDRRQVEGDDTQPCDGGISGHHMFCVPTAKGCSEMFRCSAEVSLLTQVSLISVTVSLKTNRPIRLFSLPFVSCFFVDLFFFLISYDIYDKYIIVQDETMQ